MSGRTFTSGKLIDKHGNQINVPVIAESKDFKPTQVAGSQFIDIIIDYDNETPNLTDLQRLKFAEISFPVGLNDVFEVKKIEINPQNKEELIVQGNNYLFDAENHNYLKDSSQAHASFGKLIQPFVEEQEDTRQLYEDMKTMVARSPRGDRDERNQSKQGSGPNSKESSGYV
jgi:hypothetical protein